MVLTVSYTSFRKQFFLKLVTSNSNICCFWDCGTNFKKNDQNLGLWKQKFRPISQNFCSRETSETILNVSKYHGFSTNSDRKRVWTYSALSGRKRFFFLLRCIGWGQGIIWIKLELYSKLNLCSSKKLLFLFGVNICWFKRFWNCIFWKTLLDFDSKLSEMFFTEISVKNPDRRYITYKNRK